MKIERMKILHTSDWHIGRYLYGRMRYEEFAVFLDWLADFISAESVDVLLVAGDIFDTSMPSNRAQELYYGFLCKVSASCCRHVVVIAGNHDSPSFLNAPKELLRALNVHVVGLVSQDPEDEVIFLKDGSNAPEAIICAVPYLRDRDIRSVAAGESVIDKGTKLIEGIKEQYARVCVLAEEKRVGAGEIPVIGMGHLFAAGGKTLDGDGVRELYVGSLAHVSGDVFPPSLDYLALGHLHVAQKVGTADHIRYSGSPVPMGFGEARQQKIVITVTFDGSSSEIEEHPIPTFQSLEKVCGGMDEIIQKINELKHQSSTAWLEIEYTGAEVAGNLRELIESSLRGSRMEVLRIKNRRIVEKVMNRIDTEETLDDLESTDVFMRCLESHKITEEERPALILSYKEIIATVHEEDSNEE